jgi:phosphatidylserine/phosphatidylglycerophosphate/cardiolipin synthase-like enzyme
VCCPGLLRPSIALISALIAAAATASEPPAESIEELVVRVGRTRWTTGNAVELLDDPRLAWQARIQMVEGARHHLFISTFNWKQDERGTALRERLQAAVEAQRAAGNRLDARVLVDASTLGIFSTTFDALEDGGARVRGFNRSSWGLSPIYDGRMHDKIMIMDGREALVGGRNLSDIYFDERLWWLDLGVRLRGPAVDDIQMIFLKSWELTSFISSPRRFLVPQEKLLEDLRHFWRSGRYPNGRSPLQRYLGPEYFPPHEVRGDGVAVAVLYDNSLLRRRAASTDLVIALVGRAERRIDLMTPFPYFTADLTESLLAAAARGVEVRLLTNGRDTALRGGPFLYAGYPTIMRLIEGGVGVWAWRANKDTIRAIEATGCVPDLMPPVAIHGKMLRVDDDLSIVHSSNFNIRSTYYNTEAGVVVHDTAFNRRLGELVEGLIAMRGVELACTNGVGNPVLPPLLERLRVEDLPRMREELGDRQRFLDAYSAAW